MGATFEIPVNAECEHCKLPIYRWPRALRWFLNTREIEREPGQNVAKCNNSPNGQHNP